MVIKIKGNLDKGILGKEVFGKNIENIEIFTNNGFLNNLSNLYDANLTPNSIQENLELRVEALNSDSYRQSDFYLDKYLDSRNFAIFDGDKKVKIGSLEPNLFESFLKYNKNLENENIYDKNSNYLLKSSGDLFNKIDSEVFDLNDFSINQYKSKEEMINNKVLNYLIQDKNLLKEHICQILSLNRVDLRKYSSSGFIEETDLLSHFSIYNQFLKNKKEQIGFLSIGQNDDFNSICMPDLYDFSGNDSIIIGKYK